MSEIWRNEKRAALIPSVGADEEQSSIKPETIIPYNNSHDNTAFYGKEERPFSLSSLPASVQSSGRFCCWRYEQRGNQRTKVPYNPITGERAKSNAPGSFASYDEAVRAKGYDGLGIGIFGGLCAIDIDHCISDGQYTETALEIIQLMHSYTEVSPSGTGVHILFAAPGFVYDTEAFYIMNRSLGIEVYVAGATNKYVTVTGQSVSADEFGDRSRELSIVLDRFMRRTPVHLKSEKYARNAINATNSDFTILSDDEIVKKALSAANGSAFKALWEGSTVGYPSHSEADLALCMRLAFWTGRNPVQMDSLFRQSGLMREKWDSARAGITYGESTIQRAIGQCRETYTPPKKPDVKPIKADAIPVKQEVASKPISRFIPIRPLAPQWSDLPAFPLDALPETLRSYAAAVAEHSQTSPDMASVIGLGVLSVCLQGKYQVEGTPGYTEQLSLYTAVIASSGERKSGVMRPMTRPLYEYEHEYNEQHASEIRQNHRDRETLQRRINTLQKKEETSLDWVQESELFNLQEQLADMPELKPLRLYADDCSSEALASLMAANSGTISVISTEGGIFDVMAGRYNSRANIDVWLKGHCGDAIYVDRKTREAESILHPTLSAILTIQPSVLEEIMDNTTMSGRGLLARFLYSFPPSRIGTRTFRSTPIPADVNAAYRKMVFDLMNIQRPAEPKTLILSAEAGMVLDEYFGTHERYLVGEGQAIADWASKYIGTVLRIAGLLHAAELNGEDRPSISAQTMNRAIRIGAYFLAHAQYAYSMMGTDLCIQKAKFVMAKLTKKNVREIKRNELFQMCRGKFFKKTDELFPTLELLEDHGYLLLEQPIVCSVGRPPDVKVIVNPEVLNL